ncbi:MAG: YgjV family protein [Parcubacteria group bacterium]|nr:YgjV family protein [Parcubacteria group bacterium]
MILFGILGLLIISYALWVRDEIRQNNLFIIGGAFLLVYSLAIDEAIFVALQLVFIISAVLELVKIREGRTHHGHEKRN